MISTRRYFATIAHPAVLGFSEEMMEGCQYFLRVVGRWSIFWRVVVRGIVCGDERIGEYREGAGTGRGRMWDGFKNG